MYAHVKKSCLLPTLLVVALGLVFTGRVSAQAFKSLYSFTLAPNPNQDNSDGRNPYGGIIISGNALFGTTFSGGQHGSGTVFGLNTDGSGFITFYPFDQEAFGLSGETNHYGGRSKAPLVFTGTALYGTTSSFGTNGNGTVFELSLATGVKVLHTFMPTANRFGVDSYAVGTNGDGSMPVAGLVLSGTSLYGTAQSAGTNGTGTIFKVDNTTGVFTNLHNFDVLHTNQFFAYTNSDGANPLASLVLSGSTLYGTTSAGGHSGNGTLFSMSTNGTGFMTLHNFSAVAADFDVLDIETNGDGANPSAALIVSNNVLYGTATFGGTNGYGTVFSINTSGTGFTVLHTFTPVAVTGSTIFGPTYGNYDGAEPEGSLLLSGSILYGTAVGGGASGSGTLFAMGTNGAGFVTMYAFSATTTNNTFVFTNFDGTEPMGLMVLSSNVLYGNATFGGSSGDGTVFSFSILPQLDIVRTGTNIIMTWPMNLTGFTLESTTNLGPTADWITNATAPIILNGRWAFTNSTSGKQKFFRLTQ